MLSKSRNFQYLKGVMLANFSRDVLRRPGSIAVPDEQKSHLAKMCIHNHWKTLMFRHAISTFAPELDFERKMPTETHKTSKDTHRFIYQTTHRRIRPKDHWKTPMETDQISTFVSELDFESIMLTRLTRL